MTDFPLDIAFNPAGNFAYISTTNNVRLCNVDPSTGVLSNCAPTGPGFGFFFNSVELNPAGTFAYVSSGATNQVIKCSVQANGTLDNCAATGPGFLNVAGITLNPAGTFAYIGSGNFLADAVSVCTVDGVTGNFTSCDTPDAGFQEPTWVAINPLNTTAYVTIAAQYTNAG